MTRRRSRGRTRPFGRFADSPPKTISRRVRLRAEHGTGTSCHTTNTFGYLALNTLWTPKGETRAAPMATHALPQSTDNHDSPSMDGTEEEQPATRGPRKRVAIVGSGVAGLSAAWALNEYSHHEAVVFEASDYIGGHTHTVEFTKDDKTTPVDSGFIVSLQGSHTD